MNSPKFRNALLLAALGGLLAVPTSLAQDAPAPPSKSQLAIKYRQSTLFLLAWNMGPIGDMVQGKRPFDAAIVKRNANALAVLAPRAIEGFGPDTSSGAPTRAKPEIWDNLEDFRQKFLALEQATQALLIAANTGDQAKVTPALMETGKACKACHDKYKAD